MSENVAGSSGSPPVRPGRLVIPPRNIPCADSNQFLSDPRQGPMSPISPGKRSPGRSKTMKEYEEDLVNLKRENFNLKVRIYFMEQNRIDPNLPKDIEEMRTLFNDLKVEHELQKKDLTSKEDLLLNTYRALEVQKQQLETIKSDYDALKLEYDTEKLELQSKISYLESELKEYHSKFMETSIQLDDTNAMYAITFGLEQKKAENQSEEKIKELENNLAKERERVLMLEDKVSGCNAKSAKERDELEKIHEQVHAMEQELEKALHTKSCLQKLYEESRQAVKAEKTMTKSVLKKKESEVESMKMELEALKEDLKITKYKLKEREVKTGTRDPIELEIRIKSLLAENAKLKKECSEVESLKAAMKTLQDNFEATTNKLRESQSRNLRVPRLPEYEIRMSNLQMENAKLKKEVKRLQLHVESIGPLSPSTRRSSDHFKEQARQLEKALDRIEELKREILELRVTKDREVRSGDAEGLIQVMVKDNKLLRRQVDEYKAAYRKAIEGSSSKEEVAREVDELRKMTSEKDSLISALKYKIVELTEAITAKESLLQEYKMKLDSVPQSVDSALGTANCDVKSLECNSNNQEREKEGLTNELEEKKKEVECLKRELKKRTFNLQGLVNTELWDKNREIEKLNKVCERKQIEVLALKKQLRESQVQDKVTTFASPISLQSGLFLEDKENLHPGTDPKVQLQHLAEENRQLVRKVEELQARLLNTPERDAESLLVQTLRAEREQADKLRKEAVNACVLLTTRLQELADFLDSLLPSLCGRKRKVVQQAVERSRELSRSLSMAAEESSLHHCSAWTDLQPSLYIPLLPDISTVDFWSGDDCQEETFSGVEEVAKQNSKVEEVKQKDGDLPRSQSGNALGENFLSKSVFGNDQQQLVDNIESRLLGESEFYGNLADITEGSLVESSDQNGFDKTQPTKLSPEVKSANIGKITLSSRKKDTKSCTPSVSIEGKSKSCEKDGLLSEYETWSEPDRDVSYARMGLTEEQINMNKSAPCNFDDTSETADSVTKSPSSRRASEIQRLQRKVRNLEQVNEALRSELVILHQLTPTALSRQDKATSIELSRQNIFCVPTHLMEEIRNQREKLEASLFHNDYIRRQLESTVSSLRRSQGDDQEKASFVRLKEVTNQLELAENELSELKLEKEHWNKQRDMLQTTLQQNSSELIEKQRALLELEDKTTQRIQEVEEKFSIKSAQTEQKCTQLEQKWCDLQQEKDQLLEKISESNQQIIKLSTDIEQYELEGKKNKKVQEDLNLRIQQMNHQKDDLQRLVAEQEQLLADAERERQELATQLIARDRQVSDLQKRLSCMELNSSELEAALRSQLDIALDQCAQFEARIRDLDNTNKRREEGVAVVEDLQRRLDAARFAHSEAVLQYTRVANENIRMQQELRRRQQEPNQIAVVERIKCELERRVAELEAVNAELESRLVSLNVAKIPSYSDCETDGGSSAMGSPRRPVPPPLLMPSSPPPPHLLPSSPQRLPPIYKTQRSQDLTSDYLSDQEIALSSPQTQTRNMWFPTSPHSLASASPDLGIESDHGRLSSLETHVSSKPSVALVGSPVKEFMKLEEENTQLRHNLQKTRYALEETLAQLTAANQHKRQYEAQLSAANQHKEKVERAICRQLHKTHSILKKARVNLEDGKSEH